MSQRYDDSNNNHANKSINVTSGQCVQTENTPRQLMRKLNVNSKSTQLYAKPARNPSPPKKSLNEQIDDFQKHLLSVSHKSIQLKSPSVVQQTSLPQQQSLQNIQTSSIKAKEKAKYQDIMNLKAQQKAQQFQRTTSILPNIHSNQNEENQNNQVQQQKSQTSRERTLKSMQQKLEQFKVKSSQDIINNTFDAENTLPEKPIEQRIAEGVEELRRLRKRRRTEARLKKLERIKRKYEEALTKNQSNGETVSNIDGNLSVLSNTSYSSSLMSDTLSKTTSVDSLFRRIDEMSLTTTTQENNGQDIANIDDIDQHDIKEQSNCEHENQQDVNINHSIQTTVKAKTEPSEQETNHSHQYSKSTLSKSKAVPQLDSILEEYSDYFDHVAGKCACGECYCGKCQLKCKVISQKPPALDVLWQSSYNRSHNKLALLTRSCSDANALKFLPRQSSYQSSSGAAQDYTSMFKNDFKTPVDPDFKRVKIETRIPPRPLYNLSNYKSNYYNWGPDARARKSEQLKESHKIVLGTPLMGNSQSKRDYSGFFGVEKTSLAKPKDQVPFSQHQYDKGIDTIKESADTAIYNIPFEKTTNQHFQEKYTRLPTFEGQYKSQSKREYKQKDGQCAGNHKLYEQYKRKIEKYQRKLESELQLLEAK